MRDDFTQLSMFSNSALSNDVIAITGTLPIHRRKVIEMILLSGGQYRTSVTRHTTILVVGKLNRPAADGLTRKLRTAQLRAIKGESIRMISYDDLLTIIS